MESEVLDSLCSNININKEPFFIYLKDLPKLICRLIIKNLSIFIKLYYYQYHYIYNKFDSTYFYSSNAGDIYQGFRILMKNSIANEKVILNRKEFALIISKIADEIKYFPTINNIVEQYEEPFEKVWNVFRLLILPIRINAGTIPLDERKFILKIWMSTVFTIPLLDSYNGRYIVNKRSLSALRSLFPAFGVNLSKNFDENPKFDENKLNKIEETDDNIIDLYVSPINSDSVTNKIFRTYVFLSFLSSIEIIRKPCLNLKECKEINPDYDGSCINVFDDYVNSQIKKIQESISILVPSSIE